MDRLTTGDNLVAWPESSKINRMHGGSREWGLVRLATANLTTSLTVNSLCPLIPRRTIKKPAIKPASHFKPQRLFDAKPIAVGLKSLSANSLDLQQIVYG